ncbi:MULTISPECIES: hypothetical protein [Saccharothrix]|uniref:hypothetical protein n=1 Tax=Saccharothrix TaxID=2071 RepID=UPI00093B339E|nr:hypothetical protein [Saccharothrix sp. CB00851]OKI36561.1 hypothetical protein A6A25_21000 [Saccharothrix sp. CB00851]
MNAGQGYHVELDLIEDRITTLTRLGDLTGDLVTAVSRLAERQPMLGTAPPAVELAQRLREAAGESGLAGEVSAAQREVEAFRQVLSDAKASYTEVDDDASASVRAAGERSGREAT